MILVTIIQKNVAKYLRKIKPMMTNGLMISDL